MSRICLNCGTQVEDNSIQFCPNCGRQLGVGVQNGHKSGLLTAAKVLMILSCVAIGWTLIPLAWLIPMTIKISNREKGGEKLSTGFKVCVILFGNMLAGILLLCDDQA